MKSRVEYLGPRGAERPLTVKEEFEKSYAEKSGLTLKDYHKIFKTVKCDCDYEGCKGWMADSDRSDWELIYDKEIILYPPQGGVAGWQVSQNNIWVPGAYATREAAKKAVYFPGPILKGLDSAVFPWGLITEDMLDYKRAVYKLEQRNGT